MVRSIILGVVLAVVSPGVPQVLAAAPSVQAGMQRCPHCGRYHIPVSQASQSVSSPAPSQQVSRSVRTVTPQRQNFLGRLWELEKRKNAWLMRTFLRR